MEALGKGLVKENWKQIGGFEDFELKKVILVNGIISTDLFLYS